MNLKNKLFGKFDFNALDDPEFNEDAVREDVIAPMLRKLGYSASGHYRIIRSRQLDNPSVMFGTTSRKLTYIPDYLLEIEGKPRFVLDAKGPRENIESGKNVEQVYSYAIHRDIRTDLYGLCNGRKLTIFHISSIKPLFVYDLASFSEFDVIDLNEKMGPRMKFDPRLADYIPDGGAYLHFVVNVAMSSSLTFLAVPLIQIRIIGDGKYTMNIQCDDIADRPVMMTYDFNQEHFDSFLHALDDDGASRDFECLTKYPFKYDNVNNPCHVDITCKQAEVPVFSQAGEMFFPFDIINMIPTKNANKPLQ